MARLAGMDAAAPLVLAGDYNVAPQPIDVWDEVAVHGGSAAVGDRGVAARSAGAEIDREMRKGKARQRARKVGWVTQRRQAVHRSDRQ